ncbi:uncharacterized protein [Euwallacea similis]|uniref:uncharacterized protein n=1 Tax=Euwallacea similis TaxID=1736056 RepID=UPI00344FEB5B
MLRTRRRDNNVKPNRRLDRKSSRGMLYENEELRLKTININAEIERGQSDIKKLKRENEMLKKEIWCLRDEYDKLDKLLKDKKLDFSSSSTTYSSSSDSESCSSCTEEPEEEEASQNLKNVQKSNLKNIHDQFDHLSIVTEETCENSDKNSSNNRHSLSNDQTVNMLWNYNDKDVIQPDQSYPVYGTVIQNKSQTLPSPMHMNYFAPIQHSKSFDDNQFTQVRQEPLYPEDLYTPPPLPCHNDRESPPVAISPSPPPLYENQQVVFPQHTNNSETENFLSKKVVHTNATNFYQNVVLAPKSTQSPPETQGMEKKATDLIVKIDNQNFSKNLTYSNTTPSTTFSNGGNLEELLHDIESISQDILKLTNFQRAIPNPHLLPTIQEPPHGSPHFEEQNFFEAAKEDEQDLTYSQNPVLDHLIDSETSNRANPLSASEERLHKSELNVVLMPKAMPLIGFDKYKNIQRSFESINSNHLDSLSASQQNLCLIPPNQAPSESNLHVTMPMLPQAYETDHSSTYPTSKLETSCQILTSPRDQDYNPFFFGNLTDNYVNSDYFSRRYNPDNFIQKTQSDSPEDQQHEDSSVNPKPIENEENIKLKTTKVEGNDKASGELKQEKVKLPKMSITKKVSIHFKGKKEKDRLKKLAIGGCDPNASVSKPSATTPKPSIIVDSIKPDPSSPKPKERINKHVNHQKTPSIESKKSTTETSNVEPKTPNSSESDKKKEPKKEDKKARKSVSISPDRVRHVHLMHDALKKHKKHRRSGGSRIHQRGSMDPRQLRERSYSICTDRSQMGPSLGFGMGYGSFLYDDYSDRERTNSGSSCESHENHRKMSGISNVAVNGKVPWCGCWGNGCL